jgi:uncharacterized protein
VRPSSKSVVLVLALSGMFASVVDGEPRGAIVSLLRDAVAEAAVAQLEAIDAAWEPSQRDCAGLVRFTYRAAYKRFAPDRLRRSLWRDSAGMPVDFADAETLLQDNFAFLGRDSRARDASRSGDLVAFRQPGNNGEPVYHLMLLVRTRDPAHLEARVIYHPGLAGAAVREGSLRELTEVAPLEWKPVAENRAFLGFFRFKEWMNE